ncbi:MAG: sensor histidine kinase [Pseudomonadota bacterium]
MTEAERPDRDDLKADSSSAADLATAGRARLEKLRGQMEGAASSVRERLEEPFSFSSLTRRIIALNLAALVFLLGGVLYLSQFRDGLIDLRLASLKTEAELIAITIAESAGEPNNQSYDRLVANEILRRVALPAGLRAQIYDRSGRLTGDTRALPGSALVVEVEPLRAPGAADGLLSRLEDLYERAAGLFQRPLELYQETPPSGISKDEEVYVALSGEIAFAERVNSQDELILSVAVPIKRVRTVMGGLMLSTEGGEIGEIVRDERIAILQVFFVALIVNFLLSVVLAQTIARPIRKLAEAADLGSGQEARPLNPNRIHIPNFTKRHDEIGDLSGSLRRMTDALYDRIEAIESFAADVAHEIKNPLTSLRSAVETMRLARSDDARERLLSVIENDVRRLDRLVTDISNASRLDAELVREDMDVFDFRSLVQTVVDISGPQAEKRKVEIHVRLPETALPLRGMESRLAQVLHNILDNALSFSAPGDTITVSAQTKPFGVRPGLCLEIIDEGAGIPEENLESIFSRFYSQRPEDEEFGGHSGLGLSICRQIVEAHGGAVWAENRADRAGAKFSVHLPS